MAKVTELGLKKLAASSTANPMEVSKGVAAVFSQRVEPERDGKPWCTRDDAEAMLVEAARGWMRGPDGIQPKSYRLTEAGDVLTLELF